MDAGWYELVTADENELVVMPVCNSEQGWMVLHPVPRKSVLLALLSTGDSIVVRNETLKQFEIF